MAEISRRGTRMHGPFALGKANNRHETVSLCRFHDDDREWRFHGCAPAASRPARRRNANGRQERIEPIPVSTARAERKVLELWRSCRSIPGTTAPLHT